MIAIYRALLRIVWRRADPATRQEMAHVCAASVRAAFSRGAVSGIRAVAGEILDVISAPARRDPLLSSWTGRSPLLLRGGRMFPSLHDWHTAVRRVLARPGYSALAVAILAMGIAVNTIVFSVADSALFRGLPYPNGARIVELFNRDPAGKFSFPGLTPDSFAEWREHQEVFAAFEGWNYGTFVVLGGGEPERVAGAFITPGLFAALGVSPLRGRLFEAVDGEPGRDALVLISERLWRQRFGASESVIGQTLTLNDRPHTIVGVMPRYFRFPASHQLVWVPTPVRQPPRGRLFAVGLLTPGLTPESAQPRLDAISEGLAAARPRAEGWKVKLMPGRGTVLNPPMRRALQILSAAVVIVLLIACANLANLAVAQALARQRELAVRAALGASRWRLVRELLAEHLVLGAAGGALGLAAAWWGVGIAIAIAPTELTLWSPNEIRIDGRILAYTAAATLCSALLFGILPAWRAARARASEALTSRTGGGLAHGRLRAALVVIEVALSVVLLTGAALLIRSFVKLNQVDPGFNPDRLWSVSIEVPTDRYPAPVRRAFFERMTQAIQSIPGVTAVSVANGVPTSGGNIHFGQLEIEGKRPEPGEIVLPDAVVDSRYFDTLGIRLVAGRGLQDSDQPTAAVVSQSLARKLTDDGHAIGTRFRLSGRADWYTVVGVATEVRQDRLLERDTAFEMYTPLWRPAATAPAAARPVAAGAARSFVSMRIVVRASGSEPLAGPLKAAIWSVDAAQPVGDIQPIDALLAISLAQDRFATVLMGTFAFLALVLAAAGLYAVLAQLVAQRCQEIGIRMALGAATIDVARLILGRGVGLTAAGIAIGLAGAWTAARFLASQLYGVTPHDAASFVLVPLVLLGVALLSSWLPARRALSVDPATVLRTE